MADETPTNSESNPATTPDGQAAATPPAAVPSDPPADKAAEAALKAAQDAVASLGDLADTSSSAAADGAEPFELPSFTSGSSNGSPAPIDLLSDVDLQVKIELGRTRMLVEDVLKLADGAVIELDKLAGDPVDIYVNERHVARGEVLVLNDNFCVRINEILSASSDAKKAG